MITSQMAITREGHLEAVLNLFVFICQKYNSRVVFDPTYPDTDMNDFRE